MHCHLVGSVGGRDALPLRREGVAVPESKNFVLANGIGAIEGAIEHWRREIRTNYWTDACAWAARTGGETPALPMIGGSRKVSSNTLSDLRRDAEGGGPGRPRSPILPHRAGLEKRRTGGKMASAQKYLNVLLAFASIHDSVYCVGRLGAMVL